MIDSAYAALASVLFEKNGKTLKCYDDYHDSYHEVSVFAKVYNDTFRHALSKRLQSLMDERGLTAAEVVRRTNGVVSASLICRNTSNVGFSLSVMRTLILAERAFNMSLGEFISGSRPAIVLPNDLRLVAKTLCEDASPSYIQQLLPRVSKEQRLWTAEDELTAPSDVFCSRMREVSSDRFANSVDVFSSPGQPRFALAPALRQMVDVAMGHPFPSRADQSQKGVVLRTAIYLSIRSQIPIDYLYARNYTKYAQIVYRKTNEVNSQLVQVKDESVIYLIGILLSLSSEERAKWVATITLQK